MIRKIYIIVFTIIAFVIIFILGNQMVINQFKNTSNKLLLEYHELYSLQNFAAKLNEYQVISIKQKFDNDKSDDLKIIKKQLIIVYAECENYITQHHLGENWKDLQTEFISLIKIDSINDYNYNVIEGKVNKVTSILDTMIEETKEEISEAEQKNHTINKHGSITILLIGISFIIYIFVLSFFSIKRITNPIESFLSTFNMLSKGSKEARVKVWANDEFGEMAIAFNHMIEELNEKSISLEYEKQLVEIRRKNSIAINEAQEIERSRIAADLHDGLGQKLTAISYSLQDISGQCLNKEKVKYLYELVDEVISETRNISHSLMPSILKDFGLLVALEELIERTNKTIEPELKFYHYDFNERINPKLEKAIYRICQEGLTNVLKHAKAKNVTFQLFKLENMLTLMIEDDGVGFNKEKIKETKNDGIGLISIQERVNLFNGTFTINSNKNSGTELIIEIPCDSKI